MDIQLEPQAAGRMSGEELKKLHERMKKREKSRRLRKLGARFGVNLIVSVLVILPVFCERDFNFEVLLLSQEKSS